MTSHELAKLLFSKPDLPVVTHANNHTVSTYGWPKKIKVGLMKNGYVCIGNISKRNLGNSDERIIEMWHGDAPEEWR